MRLYDLVGILDPSTVTIYPREGKPAEYKRRLYEPGARPVRPMAEACLKYGGMAVEWIHPTACGEVAIKLR